MELSSHNKFVNGLRTPVQEYERKVAEKQRSKSAKPQSNKSPMEGKDDLVYEVEALFDELFGSFDDNTSSQKLNNND